MVAMQRLCEQCWARVEFDSEWPSQRIRQVAFDHFWGHYTAELAFKEGV